MGSENNTSTADLTSTSAAMDSAPKEAKTMGVLEIEVKPDGRTSDEHHVPVKRSWIQRTFGPMIQGSARGFIFSLVASALGTGVLTLPYMLKSSGLVLGLCLISLGATLCWISLAMLAYATFKENETEYFPLVTKVLGKKVAAIFSCLIAFYGIGAAVSFQITIAEFFPEIISDLTGNHYVPTQTQRFLQIMVLALLMFPATLMRNLSGFRCGAIFGVCCILYILFVVIFQTPSYIAENDSLSKIEFFKFDMNFFTSFALAAFSFTCHSNLLPIRSELARPSLRRLDKVVRRAVAIDASLYVTMAICGYLSMADKTPQLIISRPPLSNAGSDWEMALALVAMTCTLIISIITNLAPTRAQILVLLGKPSQVDTKTHFLTTAAVLFSTSLIAFAVPNVIAALGLIGGIACVSASITFPFLIFAKIKEKEIESGESTSSKSLVWIVRFFAVLFSILGMIGAGVSFAQALN